MLHGGGEGPGGGGLVNAIAGESIVRLLNLKVHDATGEVEKRMALDVNKRSGGVRSRWFNQEIKIVFILSSFLINYFLKSQILRMIEILFVVLLLNDGPHFNFVVRLLKSVFTPAFWIEISSCSLILIWISFYLTRI